MLILASQSETRKTLLAGAGFRFAVRGARIDERAVERSAAAAGTDAAGIARALAVAKAVAVSEEAAGALVIGADQTLSLSGELLHKPASRAAAADQLARLAGHTHQLYAAAALARDGDLLWVGVDAAELTMRATTAAERHAVLALEGDRVLSSVGGYRLEGPSIRLFEAVRGDYFTVLGLPLLPLLAALRQHACETLAEPVA